jgi:hypothetical protein
MYSEVDLRNFTALVYSALLNVGKNVENDENFVEK